MHLTLSTTHQPATDLGYLVHKNPFRCQQFQLTCGRAYVYFPIATAAECRMALTLDIDPISLVRGKTGTGDGLLDQYVNDRPYVASSFLSVAIAEVFRSALQGRSAERPELAQTPIPLRATLSALPCRGGELLLRELFEPLGYRVTAERLPLDETHPEWGHSPYFTVALEKAGTVCEVLNHLYVLIPVLDNRKHYFISEDEVAKLLTRGETWLAQHPSRDLIARRYLRNLPSLARMALAQLTDTAVSPEEDEPALQPHGEDDELPTLNEHRLNQVVEVLLAEKTTTVLDAGCGEGRLLKELIRHKSLKRIVGMDVSIRALEIARERLRLDALRERVDLLHGSLAYRDQRLSGFDAIALVEVIEHLDPFQLRSAERVVFEFARPRTVVLTTPNREYNRVWPNVGFDRWRHGDHRFEWTRAEFRQWAEPLAGRFQYSVRFVDVGECHPEYGPPTQMAVFTKEERD